jgi:hypothetical protein
MGVAFKMMGVKIMFRFKKESIKFIHPFDIFYDIMIISHKRRKNIETTQPASTNPNATKAKGTLYSRAMYTVQVGLE